MIQFKDLFRQCVWPCVFVVCSHAYLLHTSASSTAHNFKRNQETCSSCLYNGIRYHCIGIVPSREMFKACSMDDLSSTKIIRYQLYMMAHEYYFVLMLWYMIQIMLLLSSNYGSKTAFFTILTLVVCTFSWSTRWGSRGPHAMYIAYIKGLELIF